MNLNDRAKHLNYLFKLLAMSEAGASLYPQIAVTVGDIASLPRSGRVPHTVLAGVMIHAANEDHYPPLSRSAVGLLDAVFSDTRTVNAVTRDSWIDAFTRGVFGAAPLWIIQAVQHELFGDDLHVVIAKAPSEPSAPRALPAPSPDR